MPDRRDAILAEIVGPDVLDVGCAGHWVKPGARDWTHGRLREVFPEITGVDVSEDNVAKMRAAGYDNVFVGDAEDLGATFGERRFDSIVAGELIEHLGSPLSFLRSARDLLKPGGRIIITTPYPFSLIQFLFALKNFPRTCWNPEHTVWLCPTTLGEQAARAGLRVHSWRLIEDYVANEDRLYRWYIALLDRLRRVIPLRLRGNTLVFVLVADDQLEDTRVTPGEGAGSRPAGGSSARSDTRPAAFRPV